jgi:hypothetical protein
MADSIKKEIKEMRHDGVDRILLNFERSLNLQDRK